MSTSTLERPRATSGAPLADEFRRVRAFTEKLCEPLETEDYVVQSMPDCSPTKWHLAHVSWFFETFILSPSVPGYRSLHPQYTYLFNSYYNAIGERHCRPKRGLISRPTVAETYRYRAYVDEHMLDLLDRLPTVDPQALHALGDALGGFEPQRLVSFIDAVNEWLAEHLASADRERMDDRESYQPPIPLGDVMPGESVATVVASHRPGYSAGDIVLAHTGWRTHALSDRSDLRKLDPAVAPVTTGLGALGMPGFTAYAGLRVIGKPKRNETVVVAAASGPVGSLVGQLAKLAGARAVGIAGGLELVGGGRDARLVFRARENGQVHLHAREEEIVRSGRGMEGVHRRRRQRDIRDARRVREPHLRLGPGDHRLSAGELRPLTKSALPQLVDVGQARKRGRPRGRHAGRRRLRAVAARREVTRRRIGGERCRRPYRLRRCV